MVTVFASVRRSINLSSLFDLKCPLALVNDTTIIVSLPLINQVGNEEIYKIPYEIRNIADFGISAMESGCKGIATMVCRLDGTPLTPYSYLKNGMAGFSIKTDGFVIGGIYHGVITLTECTFTVDKRIQFLTLVKKRIWDGVYDDGAIVSGFKYPDLCRALQKRADLKHPPQDPMYFERYSY